MTQTWILVSAVRRGRLSFGWQRPSGCIANG
jgi:hypothetical protein